MFHFAVCDDRDQRSLCAMLSCYAQMHPNCEFSVQGFASADDLYASSVFPKADAFFLDVYMPGCTGVQLAKELRAQGRDCPIVFVTTSPDFAVDAYSLDAAQYLVKPFARERFFAAVDKVVVALEKNERTYLALKIGAELRRIRLRDILYCETNNKHQVLHLQEGETLKIRISARELAGRLCELPGFMNCGVTYILNLAHVASIEHNLISMDNGEKIGVLRTACSEIKRRYWEYYFEG